MTIRKPLLTLIPLVTCTCIMCVSCNTMNGLGKDFQNIGSSLEKSSQLRFGGSNAPTQNIPSYTEDQFLLPSQ